MPFVKEAEGLDSYGCIMLSLDVDLSAVQGVIDAEDIYVDDEATTSHYTGLVDYPHVTLLYGVLDGVSAEDVQAALQDVEFGAVKLSPVACFEPEEYDVLIFEAESPALQLAHDKLCEVLPYYSTYPDYKPHCTIAYLKKGVAQKYVEIMADIELVATPIDVLYNDINDDEFRLPININITEEIAYGLYSGTTIAPINSANPQIITDIIDMKQDLYNNGGTTDTLSTFQNAARNYAGTSPVLAFDGTVDLQQTNPAYDPEVTPEDGAYSVIGSNQIYDYSSPSGFINGKAVHESVGAGSTSGGTTSSNIANPAPAVLTGGEQAHKKEQAQRIKAQLANFDVASSEVIRDRLTEAESNFVVSFSRDDGEYAIMVAYLDKSCVFALEDLLELETDMLDYVADSLLNAFVDVAEADDIKLIPDVATYVQEKMHEQVLEHKKKIKESVMEKRRGSLSAKRKVVESAALGIRRRRVQEASEDTNNILANAALLSVVNAIAARSSEFGEDYEYLTPDEVANIAYNQVGMDAISYNEVTAIANNIKDLVDAVPEADAAMAVAGDINATVADDEAVADLASRGIEVQAESMRGRRAGARRLAEAGEKTTEYSLDGKVRNVKGWVDPAKLFAKHDGLTAVAHQLDGKDVAAYFYRNGQINKYVYDEKLHQEMMSEAEKRNKTVEGWSKELGVPYGELHTYWVKAEKAADKGLPESQYWAEVNSIAQRMIGAKYGEFKKHRKVAESARHTAKGSLRESAAKPVIKASKSAGRVKLIAESLDGLEVKLKSSITICGGVDLLAELLDMAGLISDDFYVLGADETGLEDTFALAVGDDAYMCELPLLDDVVDALINGDAVMFDAVDEQITPNMAQDVGMLGMSS